MKKLTLKTLTLHDLAKRIRQRMTDLEEAYSYHNLADLEESLTTFAEIMMEENGDEDVTCELMDEFVEACHPLPQKRDKRQRLGDLDDDMVSCHPLPRKKRACPKRPDVVINPRTRRKDDRDRPYQT
jgi:hypothetical protein